MDNGQSTSLSIINTKMPNTVFLGLGSNEGNRAALLDQALIRLAEKAGTVVSRSSILETEPWGFASEHKFLNMVVAIDTSLSPTRLLDVTQRIERRLGRRKKTSSNYQDRPIDIDILLYGNRIIHTTRLGIPHPLILQREFVWRPLLEIAPDILWPLTHQPLYKEIEIGKTR